jgi:hypothetical protein
MCGEASGALFDTTSDNLVEVLQCTINAPSDGRVFISADTSLAYAGAAYEARFEIGTDDLLGNREYQRWERVFAGSAPDGLDRNLRLSVVQPVTAGQHTYYFLVTRTGSTIGTVRLYDPTLTVMFVKPGTLHSYLPLVVR